MNVDKLLELAGVEIVEKVEFGPMPETTADMETELETLEGQLNAAKRGLGIANRFRDPISKKKHKGAVLGNLNRIRARLNKITDMLSQEIAYGDEGQ